jgi:RNA polymerase sigma-70 factor (ECF subfamily)
MGQTNNPDVQLVQKATKGDRKAFTALFNRYFQSVYNYALMLCRDPALAEDLTQEAFIRAHNNLDRFGPPWNFRTWIFRLTHNYFIDLIRKEREVDPIEERDHVKSADIGPEKETIRSEAADRVDNTLNRLPVGQREILVLRELNGFSYGEIGEILDISQSNVKVSIHRARGAFQEIYGTQLLLEDPTGECQEVAGLLHLLHDNEELFDQERLVKEHLKDCEACQKRRDALIAQSMALGALVPLMPPKALAERILEQTGAGKGWGSAQSPAGNLPRILGIGGGAAVVLGAAAWFLISLFGGGFFPDLGAPEPSPEVLAPNPPPQEPLPRVHPSPSPETMYSMSQGCEAFDDLDISVILLSLPEETMILPLYFKMEGGVPCLTLDSPDVSESCPYNAWLGGNEANSCGLQGFENRLYCMFNMTPELSGLGLDLELRFNDCPGPVFTQPMVSIPDVIPAPQEPSPKKCSIDLNQAECIEAGGKMSTGVTAAPYCICP